MCELQQNAKYFSKDDIVHVALNRLLNNSSMLVQFVLLNICKWQHPETRISDTHSHSHHSSAAVFNRKPQSFGSFHILLLVQHYFNNKKLWVNYSNSFSRHGIREWLEPLCLRETRDKKGSHHQAVDMTEIHLLRPCWNHTSQHNVESRLFFRKLDARTQSF